MVEIDSNTLEIFYFETVVLKLHEKIGEKHFIFSIEDDMLVLCFDDYIYINEAIQFLNRIIYGEAPIEIYFADDQPSLTISINPKKYIDLYVNG